MATKTNENATNEFVFVLLAVFVCNPLTMFFFNLFAPQKAAEFCARPEFKEPMLFCYAFLLYWMPFYWTKHWMKQIGPENYGCKRQLRYYNEVDNSDETFLRLDKEVQEKILWQNLQNNEVLEKIGRIWRPSDECFFDLLFTQNYSAIEMLAQSGPFRKSQVKTLLEAASYSGKFGDENKNSFGLNSILFPFLRRYICKYGLSCELKTMAHEIEMSNSNDMSFWNNAIERATIVYFQRTVTNSHKQYFHATEWLGFCKRNKKICWQAQICMNLAQYHIFHSTGHKLHEEALLHFLKAGDGAMCKFIFRYEPNNGMISKHVRKTVTSNGRLYKIYKGAIGR